MATETERTVPDQAIRASCAVRVEKGLKQVARVKAELTRKNVRRLPGIPTNGQLEIHLVE